MTNPLLRAVQEYLDNESAYVRDVEGEIQRLERALDNERRQTQRRMIAALYWRAGTLDALGYAVPAVHVAGAARAMESAL